MNGDDSWTSFAARSAGGSSANRARKIKPAGTTAGAYAVIGSGRGPVISVSAGAVGAVRRRKFLVLARTYWEVEHWRRRHVLKRLDVVYMAGAWKTVGLRLSDFDGVLLPSFYARDDATEIEDLLRASATHDAGTDWPLWRRAAIERASL